MEETRIYIKGKSGFKAAVLTRLGGTWIHGTSDVGLDVLSFAMADEAQLEDFKKCLGKEITSTYDLEFSSDIEGTIPAGSQWKRVFGQPIKMSIWTNNDSKVTGKKTVVAGDD